MNYKKGCQGHHPLGDVNKGWTEEGWSDGLYVCNYNSGKQSSSSFLLHYESPRLRLTVSNFASCEEFYLFGRSL